MLPIGSVVLAAVLLGVPRALESRAFGAQRSVYVEVAPLAPELEGFGDALKRAIDGAAFSLAARPSEDTLVVELLKVATSTAADGRPVEAATLILRDGSVTRRVVLHYAPGDRAAAARRLLDRLQAFDA